MILDKVLLLKGLGGLTAFGGIAYGGTVLVKNYISKTNDQILAELISKVGLDCKTPSATGTECTKVTTEGSKINIKQGSEDTGKFEIDTITGGKIKLYKLEGDKTGYHKGLKFVIEDGDITITNPSKKLEQFETYEIEEVEESGTKKWYLKRKSTAIEEKKKLLGLPADESCKLPTEENGTATCSGITAEQLKAINFKDKDSNGATIASGGTVTLTITKVPSSDTEFSTEGYKFSFQPTEEVTISTTNKIAKNSGTEFKIKKEGNTLSLEKAWTVATLAQKLGISTCNTGEKTCDLTSSIKVWFDNSDKIDNATITGNNQKLKYEEDQEGHNQGFKFYAENEITLGNNGKKIEQKGNNGPTYEIKKQSDNNWYLSKVSPSSRA